MIRLSPCKMNVYLEVEGKRPDGFHDLYSLFIPADWSDEIHFTPISEGLQFNSSDFAIAYGNTILKAASLLEPYKNNQKGIKIYLNKIVPYQAGLGSASSNGAVALKFLSEYWNCGLSEDQLFDLSARISSDSPFFLKNVPAIVTGRGEKIQALKTSGNFYFLILKPKSIFISTAEAYQKIAAQKAYTCLKANRKDLVSSFIKGDVKKFAHLFYNTFEEVLKKDNPFIRETKKIFKELGALNSVLSGSGSAFIGVFDSLKTLEDAENQIILKNFQNLFDFKKSIL